MAVKSISELEKNYELELDRIVKEVKKTGARRVLLQFPDGLKIYSSAIVKELEKRTDNKVEFIIWLGSCFGACDTPNLGKLEKDIDLVVQFGHSAWKVK